jgi:hypothetical protein
MSDERTLIHQFFFEGGWYVTLIGAGGAIARILNSDEKHSIWDFFRKIVVAAIASGISWFVLEQADFSSFTKAIVYGVIGVVSPELIDGLIALARKTMRKPGALIDFLSKK